MPGKLMPDESHFSLLEWFQYQVFFYVLINRVPTSREEKLSKNETLICDTVFPILTVHVIVRSDKVTFQQKLCEL